MFTYRTLSVLLICLLSLAGCGGGAKETAKKKSRRSSSYSAKAANKPSKGEGKKDKADQADEADRGSDKGAAHEAESVPSDEALARLKSGNKHFVNGNLRKRDYEHEREALLNGQHPYAIVLACADSRVPPELLFDESLGKLFVVRVAGNVIDPIVLGSIEYAAEHLHSKLLMVLGHESCGAVKATLGGGRFTPNIDTLVKQIQTSARKAQGMKLGSEDETLKAAIEENVRTQIHHATSRSKLLANLVAAKEFQIVGGIYNFHTGAIEFVEHGEAPSETPIATAKNLVAAAGKSKEAH